MNDEFDLRLRKELRALADAVPTSPTVRPIATAAGYSAAHAGSQPLERVRIHRGSPIGLSAAALALIVAIIAGAALFGGLRNGRPGASAMPTASPGNSTSTAVAGLTIIQPEIVASFGTDNLTGAVLGPPADGAAYVLDKTVGTVYRISLDTGAKLPLVEAGQQPISGGTIIGNPRLLATGGPDVLVLDDLNSLWRWRPADKTGRGSLVKVNIPDNTSWGSGARAIGTFIVNPQIGQYNVYVVVPSANQILKYQPALDGSSYPKETRANYLSVPQDLNSVDDMYVDGKIYLVDGGKITQYELGQAGRGWSPADPGGQTSYYTRLTADNPAQDQGTFYAYDRANKRIVAFSKTDGSFVAQYMVPAGTSWFSAVTGMFVTTGSGGTNPTLYWTEVGNLMSASLARTAAPTPLASSGSSAPLASPNSSTAMPPTASVNPGHGFTATGSMTTRGAGPATRLADGRVLILDGTDSRAELYDPKTGTFRKTGSMVTAGSGETATLLEDGRVLIAGVFDGTNLLSSAEIYDPSTGAFSPTGSMVTTVSGETATLLQDGRVLFTGGSDGSNLLSSAEIYDPKTGTFSATGQMISVRTAHTATLLADGQVLITGGVNYKYASATAELYDPNTGTFIATGWMADARASHTATLLSDGRVLVAGGGDEGDPTTATAELYDPKTRRFGGTGSMSTAREVFSASFLADGRVLVAGGSDGNGTIFASAELFDPKTGRFSSTGSMSDGRIGQSATLITDGRVLVAGGGLATAELYQP